MTEAPKLTPQEHEERVMKRLRALQSEVRAEKMAEDTMRELTPWIDPAKGNRKERRRLRKAYRKVRRDG